MKRKILVAVAGIGLMALAAGNLQAQITNTVTITGIASVQSDDSDPNNIAKPTKFTINNKAILAQLATDYGFDNTPGNKLVAIDAGGEEGGTSFHVLSKQGAPLADVSESVFVEGGSDIEVQSGKTDEETGAGTRTSMSIQYIVFNNTGVNENSDTQVNIYFGGIGTSTHTVSKPAKNGVQKKTQSFSMKNGQGDGVVGNGNVVVTGNITAKGTGVFQQSTD